MAFPNYQKHVINYFFDYSIRLFLPKRCAQQIEDDNYSIIHTANATSLSIPFNKESTKDRVLPTHTILRRENDVLNFTDRVGMKLVQKKCCNAATAKIILFGV